MNQTLILLNPIMHHRERQSGHCIVANDFVRQGASFVKAKWCLFYIRMNKKNIHVTAAPDGGWQGKREGATRPSFTTSTKQEAIGKGRELSKRGGGELFSHGKDGKIQWRDSHGNDPCPPRG